MPVPPRILLFMADRLLGSGCYEGEESTAVGRGESPPLTGGPTEPPSRLRASLRRIYRGAMSQEPNAELREFLRSRRAKITPDQAGLPQQPGGRRVPGLRREEVAQL